MASFAHLLPPFWHDQIRDVRGPGAAREGTRFAQAGHVTRAPHFSAPRTCPRTLQYLKDDCPALDIQGFVVGGAWRGWC